MLAENPVVGGRVSADPGTFGFSALVGGLVWQSTTPNPPPAPACWHEPYTVVPLTKSGANQEFNLAALANYPVGCDALLQNNGIFMDIYDYELVARDPDYNFKIIPYLDVGDWVSLMSITNALQTFWLPEFYWTVLVNGAGQTFVDAGLAPVRNTRDITNTNIALNGVLLTPTVDFTYEPETYTYTFNIYLEKDDIVGFLPTCSKRTYNSTTYLIPTIKFDVPAVGRNQTFRNALLLGYRSASDLILTKDGVVLEPMVDYTLLGDTLRVSTYMRTQTELIVMANSKSCPPAVEGQAFTTSGGLQ